MTHPSNEPIGRIGKIANGHLSFEMSDYAAEKVLELVSILQEQFGFDSELPALGLDEIVCAGRIGSAKIAVGYDNWSGCYVMAFDDQGDELVAEIGDFLNDHHPA